MRVRPLPVSSPRLPPVTVMLPVWLAASQLQLLPGSSLKVKVSTRVSFFPTSASVSALTTSVGAKVSMLIVGMLAAVPLLPAAST